MPLTLNPNRPEDRRYKAGGRRIHDPLRNKLIITLVTLALVLVALWLVRG